ncbi:hypothetical protein LAZ67_1005515 [Cordylochernes scorpioides]|uniref:Transposase n=1 Tax=Cordylochernes scorpioides TaxID=51811 RepID=A0ABY6K322_9ARAC|nr:hypothetical protein LAZ67_1005515 [Cordylochernes scorpioides]
MIRTSSKFVPRILTEEQKEVRMDVCKNMVEMTRTDPEWMQKIITGMRYWCISMTRKPNVNPANGLQEGNRNPKRQDLQNPKWHWYLYKKPQKPNDDSESNGESSPPCNQPKAVANNNYSSVCIHFLAKHSTIQIPHPPYSPDLAPNDFFLYPKLKMKLKGRKFDNVDKIQAESKATLRNLSKSDFISCFDNWKKRWNRKHRQDTCFGYVGQKNDSSSDRRDLGYYKNNSGSDCERTLGPQDAFCPLGSQTFDSRLKGCKEKVVFGQLALFEANPEEFVSRFVTMDETWAHHFTPESKQQSMQLRHSGSPPPKKAKPVPSAGKVMVSVFWDSEGVLLLDFLNKGQTITGNYYANLVKQLREAIKEKRIGKLSRKIVYHQDNAPSHRSLQAMAAIYDSGFELLPHAPYSPDLAPSDFDLFPHLKKSLSGIHFRSDEEVIDAVTSFFESLETSFFLEGIKALEHGWKIYIDLKGDHVEK